jgi:hypothetical protein
MPDRGGCTKLELAAELPNGGCSSKCLEILLNSKYVFDLPGEDLESLISTLEDKAKSRKVWANVRVLSQFASKYEVYTHGPLAIRSPTS